MAKLYRGLISVEFLVLGLYESVSGQQCLASVAFLSFCLHPLGQGLHLLAQGKLRGFLSLLCGFRFQKSLILSLRKTLRYVGAFVLREVQEDNEEHDKYRHTCGHLPQFPG